MDIIPSKKANMEKRKRKPKEDRFPIEFISPYSLEECISRIPHEIIKEISTDTCEFRVQSDFNDKRNQFRNVFGYLQRDSETSTIVVGETSLNPTIYLFLVFAVPFLILVFGEILNSLLLSAILIGSVACLLLYSILIEQKRIAASIFNIFKPIPKAKVPPKNGYRTWFPTLSIDRHSDLPLETCTIRLRELAFSLATCKIVALDEQTYIFSVSGLYGYWDGVRASGTLHRNEQGTKILCRVGVRPIIYIGILILMSFFTVSFLVRSPLHIVFSPDLIVIPLIILGAGWFTGYWLRKEVIKVLLP